MTLKDISEVIHFNLNKLHFYSTTLWNDSHYICVFKYFDTWYLYDGLKETRVPKSGLSVFKYQPQGYILSHVLLAV